MTVDLRLLNDKSKMGRSLALGSFLYGYLELSDASELAGVPASSLEEDASRILTRMNGSRGDGDERRPVVSVVVPVFNEEASLRPLAERLSRVLSALEHQIIFVDDGSVDSSSDVLTTLHSEDNRMKVVQLSRNFGHQNALSAGLEVATGRAVILMDADGQDPPELIPELIERWRSGYDVVYGMRARREEGWWKKATARVFYRLLGRVAETPVAQNAGDFCLVDSRVADVLRALPESGQYLRGLRSWVGFRQTGVRYDRPPREAGETAYSFPKMVRLAMDAMLSFSSLPLRLASLLGLVTSFIGLVYLCIGVTSRVFIGHVPSGWTSLLAAVILLGGVQLTLIGIVGEYIARIYGEVKRRPRYIVQRKDW